MGYSVLTKHNKKREQLMKRFALLLILAAVFAFAGCQEESSDDYDKSEIVTMVWRGSFASADEIQNPAEMNAYYNTTDGCSYIYISGKWNLLAKSGKNGTDGADGTDGTYGTNGTDSIGSEGTSAITLDDSTETIDDVEYTVKSSVVLINGDEYFYTYYKFYYLGNSLRRTYSFVHGLEASRDISYKNFYEHLCPGYSVSISNYNKQGKMVSNETTTNNSYGLQKIKSTYWSNGKIKDSMQYSKGEPSSKTTYYSSGVQKDYILYSSGKISIYYQYNEKSGKKYDWYSGKLSVYDRGTLKYSIDFTLQELEELIAGSEVDFDEESETSSDSDAENTEESQAEEATTLKIKTAELDRYHLLYTDTNRNIEATFTVNKASLIDKSSSVYAQVVLQDGTMVQNFKAEVDYSSNIIKSTIVAPTLSSSTKTGTNYDVRLKIDGEIYASTTTRFNISTNYEVSSISLDKTKINLDKTSAETLKLTVSGYNFDFLSEMYAEIYDSSNTKIGDATYADLTQVEWTSDDCDNSQNCIIDLPLPDVVGTFTVKLYYDGSLYNRTVIFNVVKNPIFTILTIPTSSVDNAGEYITAELRGNYFKSSNLDVSYVDVSVGNDYEVQNAQYYRISRSTASSTEDTMIYIDLKIPGRAGTYPVTVRYEDATITSDMIVE